MTINLEKGSRINLEKQAPGLKSMICGLGWDNRATDGEDFDLDASVLMVDEAGKAIDEKGFIYFDNKTSVCGSIVHTGDNLTGEGDGDDEQIITELKSIPENVQKLIFVATIHKAAERGQNFGQVQNAYIRFENKDNSDEICRYDLSEDYSTQTCLMFGELYRKDGEWRFAATGDGFSDGLPAFLNNHGL